MKLERISISNFKSLRSAQFEPGQFGCLVGENNAGKSSVMQAIVYALKRPTLPAELFYDPSRPVEFGLLFTGVTAGHLARLPDEPRRRIENCVHGGEFTLKIAYVAGERTTIKVLERVPRDARFRDDGITAAIGGRRDAALRDAFVSTYPELADQVATPFNMAAAKDLIKRHIRGLPETHVSLEDSPLPVGIHSAISALLPEVIYIPAVKNLNDDMKTTQSTSFGRLMGLMLDDMADDLQSVTDALGQLNMLFNRGQGDDSGDARHPKVRSLESMVERLLRENFPSVKLQLEVPPPDLKSILSSALIYVDDGSKDLVENKGDGIKRTLTFCLLQAYVERTLEVRESYGDSSEQAQKPLIFLFEEPELYLHPKSQRVLFNTLARIASQHQVVVSTHSPIFFAPGVTASFVRVAKTAAAPKPEGKLYPVAVDLGSNHSAIFQLAKFENVDAAFFSSRVVLFEGESDDFYCAKLAKLLNHDWDFGSRNISMVRVSGKGNFAKYRDFFESFGIEVKIVADLDTIFDGFQHLGAGESSRALRERALIAIDRRIIELGIRAEPTADQIRSRQRSASLRQKWEGAREVVRSLQGGVDVSPAHIEALGDLFVWEADISRLKACREDAEAASALLPLLDDLRSQGICVLSRGAIEDYYPDGAVRTGSKPECALRAAELLVDTASCLALSAPLDQGRPTELEEVFAEIFRDGPARS